MSPPRAHPNLHDELKQSLKTFQEEASTYDHHPLTFAKAPSSSDDPVPSVDTLYQTEEHRTLNAPFLLYLERILYYQKVVDGVDTDDNTNPELALLKETFYIQIRYQFRLLDALAESQWQHEKEKLGLIPGVSPPLSQVHDTCMSAVLSSRHVW